MPIIFIFIGVLFLIAAVRNTLNTASNGSPGLIQLLQSDFTGPNNFLYWLAVIVILGAIGYNDELKPLSNAFLVLIVIVIVLAHQSGSTGGIFAQLQTALASTNNPSTATNTASATSNTTSQSSLLGQSESMLNNLNNFLATTPLLGTGQGSLQQGILSPYNPTLAQSLASG